jgi:hypothetical protein
MSYNSGTNTLTMNEKVIVNLDEFLNGNVTIGNASTDALIVNSGATFNSTVSGLTKATVGLGNVENTSDLTKVISSAAQTALNLKANDNAVVHLTGTESIGGQKTFSTGITLNGSDLNTRLTSDESTISSHTSSISTLNTNVTNLQTKTSNIAYDSGTNTTTFNDKVKIQLDGSLNGNTTIGNASTDILTVNATTTFNSTVNGLTKSTVGLSNIDNTSDVNKPVSTAQQTALNLKANDNAVVHLTGGESIGGQKTFSSSPIVPTVSQADNSTKVASTAYVDTAVSNLINSAPSALNSLSELATALGNDANYSTTITTALGTKGSLSNDNTWLGDQTFSGDITFQSQDLASRLATDETNISNNTSAITTLQGKTSALSYDAGTDTTTINSKMVVSKDVSEIGSIYLGDSSGGDIIYVRGNINSNSQTVTPQQLGYLSTVSSNVQTQINAKANDSAVIHNTGTESISGQKTFSTGITLNGTDLQTRLASDESTISSHTSSISSINSSITTLNGKTSALSYDAGTDTTTINSKMVISKDVSEIGSIYLGDSSGGDIIYIRGNINSNSQTVTPAQIGYVSGASSNLQTQINAKANDSAVADTWAGIKTFSSAPVLPNNSITNAMINNTAINSGYVDATSSIQTQINAKATDSLTCHLAGTETISGAKTFSGGVTLSSNITANSATITPTELSYIDGVTSNLQTQLDAKATDSLTCHLAGTETVTGAKTFSGGVTLSSNISANSCTITPTELSYIDGVTSNLQTQLDAKAGLSSNNTLSGTNNINMLNENINCVSGVTTSLSLDYTSGCKGINLIATPTSNYSLAVTNVPTGSTNATYSITLITTAKFYVNSITVNGTSRTIYASGGTSNISVNGSASYVMQQLNICFLNSSTPVVFSSVLSIW